MKLGFLISLVKRIYPFKLILQKKRIKAQFPNEIKLLKGQHESNNTHQSILFFTTHKCASVYVGNILKDLAQDIGMTPIDLDGYFWLSGKNRKSVFADSRKAGEVFKLSGYLYGPFRSFREIPNIEDYRILLMLRDPRDVLTSLYFSSAYSHFDPNPPLIGLPKWRKEALEQTIDEFVINKSQEFLEKYQEYYQKLLGKNNVLLLKYEDMISDYNTWLTKIVEFLEVDPNPHQFKNKNISKPNSNHKKEEIYSHKRQVTPGDHKQKLKSETISILDADFDEILNIFSYEKDNYKK